MKLMGSYKEPFEFLIKAVRTIQLKMMSRCLKAIWTPSRWLSTIQIGLGDRRYQKIFFENFVNIVVLSRSS